MSFNRNRYSLLAWVLFAIITILSLIGLVETFTNRQPDDNILIIIDDLLGGSYPLLFAFLAALIINRQPRNVIGWLMMLIASATPMEVIVKSYLDQFPVPPPVPSVQILLAVALENLIWLPLLFPLLFIMLLFPDGRLPGLRWRWIIYVSLAMIAFIILFGSVSDVFTRSEDSDWIVANPVGLLPAGVEFPMIPWSAVLVVVTLLCAAAPFVRYRRSKGMEREQIKWLFFACTLFAVNFVLGIFLRDTEGILSDAWNVLFGLGFMTIPIAIAIAILRYRLYDIDVIIRKTLVYGALTGALAFAYFGSVVLQQALFEAVTGQRSPVAIVISTLLIAALSAPLHRRLQDGIDRRFFRKKYNAQMILAQFAQAARDEVELEALTAELVRVTIETVQPQSVSIWLKDRAL